MYPRVVLLGPWKHVCICTYIPEWFFFVPGYTLMPLPSYHVIYAHVATSGSFGFSAPKHAQKALKHRTVALHCGHHHLRIDFLGFLSVRERPDCKLRYHRFPHRT